MKHTHSYMIIIFYKFKGIRKYLFLGRKKRNEKSKKEKNTYNGQKNNMIWDRTRSSITKNEYSN